jgi:hypothetical protein
MSQREKLEERFGVELSIDLDSAKENCADEEFGDFIQCSVSPNPIPNYEPPVVVIYYDQDLVQLWNDAAPYPVAANTESEVRDMWSALNPYPVRTDQITKDDFDNFIKGLVEEYGEE